MFRLDTISLVVFGCKQKMNTKAVFASKAVQKTQFLWTQNRLRLILGVGFHPCRWRESTRPDQRQGRGIRFMLDQKERRRSPRLHVTLPVFYEVLPVKEVELPSHLAKVYERVHPNVELQGEQLRGMIRDLSVNGAFITGPTVPLLSRILLRFPLPAMAQVEAVGWVLWRRKEDCVVERPAPSADGSTTVTLSAGFGVLFEAIPSQARQHIGRLVRMNSAASSLLASRTRTPDASTGSVR